MSVFYSVMPETFKLIVDRKDGISHNGNFESTHADIFSCRNSFGSFQILVQGTKHLCLCLNDDPWFSEYPEAQVVLTDDMEFNHELEMKEYSGNNKGIYEQNLPAVWRNITQEQIEAGHGGMDTLTLQAFFGAALSGEEMPIDVYDAATWMVITCLTEASIANGGMPVDIPDFTNGKWILREPKDVAQLL